MRQAHFDYVTLFRRFPLVTLRDDTEYNEAIAQKDWLASRTELSVGALEYQHVLDLVIADYEARMTSLAFADDDDGDDDTPPDLTNAEKPKRRRRKVA